MIYSEEKSSYIFLKNPKLTNIPKGSSISTTVGFPNVPTRPNSISPFCGFAPLGKLSNSSSDIYLGLEVSNPPDEISLTE